MGKESFSESIFNWFRIKGIKINLLPRNVKTENIIIKETS